jgi:hypothetical protein
MSPTARVMKSVLLGKSGDGNNPELRSNNVWVTSGGENYHHCLLLQRRYLKNLRNRPHKPFLFRRKKVLTYALTITNLNKQGFDVLFLHSRFFGFPEPRDSPINCDTSLSHSEHARLLTRQRLLILLQIIVVL